MEKHGWAALIVPKKGGCLGTIRVAQPWKSSWKRFFRGPEEVFGGGPYKARKALMRPSKAL